MVDKYWKIDTDTSKLKIFDFAMTTKGGSKYELSLLRQIWIKVRHWVLDFLGMQDTINKQQEHLRSRPLNRSTICYIVVKTSAH